MACSHAVTGEHVPLPNMPSPWEAKAWHPLFYLQKMGARKSGPHFERSIFRACRVWPAYAAFLAFFAGFSLNCGSLSTKVSGAFSNAAGQFGQQK